MEAVTETGSEAARRRDLILAADVPVLLAALAELTGDTALLKPEYQPRRPKGASAAQALFTEIPKQGGLSGEVLAAAVNDAEIALQRYLASGGADLDEDQLRSLREACLKFLTEGMDLAGTVLEEILRYEINQKDVEELYPRNSSDYDGGATPSVTSGVEPAVRKLDAWQDATPEVEALIVGTGMAGISAAKTFDDYGIEYVAIERNRGVGGVWWENRYPGCRIDTFNFQYSFSFAPRNWKHFYSVRDEVSNYLEDVAATIRLYDNTYFETEVVVCEWSEEDNRWRVTLRSRDGQITKTVKARYVVTAMGHNQIPKIPEIEGLESFRGSYVHTARWDPELNLAGKRVAVVGSGASALQVVPAIAGEVSKLYVLQRSAPWLTPDPVYHDELPEGLRILLQQVPNLSKWIRAWQQVFAYEGMMSAVVRDPEWGDKHGASSSANFGLKVRMQSYIWETYADRPDLLAKSVPDIPIVAKRLVRDDGSWARALKMEHAQLIDENIKRVGSDYIETGSGERFTVDVIVFATGFRSSGYLEPITFLGREGRDLHAEWNGDPKAFKNITYPGFPNLFMVSGPNSALAASGSTLVIAENCAHYIAEQITYMRNNGFESVEPKSEPLDRYVEWIDNANQKRVWSTPGTGTWYQNSTGRVSQVWPFKLDEHWKMTHTLEPSSYLYAGGEGGDAGVPSEAKAALG